jgi:type II secretory pathway pseudopilin PulG
MGRPGSQAGITFVSVIFMVMIFSIMSTMAAKSWSGLMKREREEELMFRGGQIFKAISTWHRVKPGSHPGTPLRELKDLCKDPRSLQNIRYLRCDPEKKEPLSYMLLDPVTGKEFEVIKGGPGGGIVGVKSTSEIEPLKQANFDDQFKHFEGKKKYSEWLFVPAKFRPSIVKTIDTKGGTGTLDMKSPFLPDEKAPPKTR